MALVTAAGDSRKPMAKNQIGVAVLVLVLVIAVGVGLYFLLKSDKKKATGPVTPSIGPVLMTPQKLRAESKFLGVSLYWAGPLPGYSYEFTRNTKGYYYVRYLPQGTPAGTKGANWTVVSTYPWNDGYHSLKKAAHGAALPGVGGSIYYVNPSFRSSVLVAWPNVNYQVEVYDPKPAIAATIASTGQLIPVRG